MDSFARYPRLFWSFARYCLVRELSFRVNFVTRCVADVLWLGLIVAFFEIIFLNTDSIGGWDRWQYLFFMATGFILNGIIGTFFLDNCTNLSDLIREGNLDFALIKPIDEQFLISFERMDWSSLPSLGFGVGLLFFASWHLENPLTFSGAAGYFVLIVAGTAVMYSLLLTMAASSVWIVRNQGLYEMWFYVNQFSRYPAEVYHGNVAADALRFGLTFILPVLLAINVPARFGARSVDWQICAYLAVAAVISLLASRWFFRYALRAYRSASS